MVSADGFMWFLVSVSTRLISEQWNKDISAPFKEADHMKNTVV